MQTYEIYFPSEENKKLYTNPVYTIEDSERYIVKYYYIHNSEIGVEKRLHREDGPAIEVYLNGILEAGSWYRYGIHHRIGGPAVECYKEGWEDCGMYYIEDAWYETVEEYNQALEVYKSALAEYKEQQLNSNQQQNKQ